MKKIITVLLLFVLIIPNSARADFIAPRIIPTFENESHLATGFLLDDSPITDISTTTISSAGPHTITYTVAHTDEPRWGTTDLERDTQLAQVIRDNLYYLELWRGSPYSPDASLVESWDISGTATGTVTTSSILTPGQYFLVAEMPNFMWRDPVAACAIYDQSPEECASDKTLYAGSLGSARTYFKTPADINTMAWGVAHSNLLFMGGARFAIAAPHVSQTSNILFIPGVTTSRLYENVSGSEKKRWELGITTSQSDARALYLDETGKSVNTLYTKADGIIAHVQVPVVGFDVYKTFFEQLQGLKDSGKINEYKLFPYDWRMSPDDVVTKGVVYDDGTHYLMSDLQTLASTSATGKVTIIGHSNGGLMAKLLMVQLAKEGKQNLVDTVMLVDSPQLGTPDTFSSMLHGEFGKLTGYGGIFLSKKNARGLAENMPSAYALLPSPTYFSKIGSAPIDVNSAPILKKATVGSSGVVRNAQSLLQFITETTNRKKPESSDVETPNTLSVQAYASSSAMHATIDTWAPSQDVDSIQITGWGLDTPATLSYVESQVYACTLAPLSCGNKKLINHHTDYVVDGDATVLAESAVSANRSSRYYINLFDSNKDKNENRSHGDVTENNAFQNLFEILRTNHNPSTLPKYVSTTTPQQASSGARLRLRISGNTSVQLTDTNGLRTGTVEQTNPEIAEIESQIPNSYVTPGNETYVGVGSTARLSLTSMASGTLAIESTSVVGGRAGITMSLLDIPVTTPTTAVVTLDPAAVTPPVLTLDTDGDGTADVRLIPIVPTSDALTHLHGIQTNVPGLGIKSTTTEERLTAKLNNLESLILRKTTWDARDDDNDQNDIRRGEQINKRILRKIEKINLWVEAQSAPTPAILQYKKLSPPAHLTKIQEGILIGMLIKLAALIK
jgi:pimeloyl-ACP methyl ester carboxylesterase